LANCVKPLSGAAPVGALFLAKAV